MKAIAYTRVSTKEQGRSSLGLDAQMNAIVSFAMAENMTLVDFFQDVDSGGKDDREGLNKAIAYAQEHGATIIVAKLDRLSRDVHYISGLMKHGVPFVVAELGKDVPTFMLHVYASFAQLEREMIGKRTKDALHQAKLRGVKLGSANVKTLKVHQDRGLKNLERLWPHIQNAESQGYTSNSKKAMYLNENGITTSRGKAWTAKNIAPIMVRIKKAVANGQLSTQAQLSV